ncbi:unnamed protein product [Victoria cruziana]
MSFRRRLAGILQTLDCRHDPGARLLRRLTIVPSSHVARRQARVPHSFEGKPVVSATAAHGGFSMSPASKTRGFKSSTEGENRDSFSLSDSREEMELPDAPAQNKARTDNSEYPRPAEIPWQEKVANSVNLIGRVGAPVHLETFPDGSAYAIAILEQKKTPNFPQLWIPVIFQDELAGIAACHLKEDDRIHVSGQLSADSPQIVIEDRLSTVHVMAQSLSFIRENPHGGRTEPLHKRLPHATHLAGKGSTRGSKISESHWDDFLMNPHNWWDARLGKVNPRQPDFIHKESNQGLWLRESSPSQVLLSLEDSVFCQKLEQLDTDKQKVSIFANNLWDDLLSNPGNWVDIRNSKTKTNRPDFKHKISGDALWIGKTTPLPVTLALETPDFCEKLIKGKTV